MESDAAGAREVVLDFFGVSVKAQDVTSFINRMQLLASKVHLLKSLAPAPPFLKNRKLCYQ